MALINMQSAEHSCSNSSTLCVCVYLSVCERDQQSGENGMEWAYSDSLGALQNINRFCFVTLNRLKGINAWDRVEGKRPPSEEIKHAESWVWQSEMLKITKGFVCRCKVFFVCVSVWETRTVHENGELYHSTESRLKSVSFNNVVTTCVLTSNAKSLYKGNSCYLVTTGGKAVFMFSGWTLSHSSGTLETSEFDLNSQNKLRNSLLFLSVSSTDVSIIWFPWCVNTSLSLD